MKTFISYTTGCIALISVSAAVLATLHFLATNPEAGGRLAAAMLGGVGTAMGAFIGSALILRFKTSRRFVHRIIKGEDD